VTDELYANQFTRLPIRLPWARVV